MMLGQIKRFLLGQPLANELLSHEKLPKWKALSTLSSDALSSVAYATGEILVVLAAATSTGAANWSLPIALAICALLLILTLSYRQTIQAYPSGGGAYIVAKENLGLFPGLIAGASLLIDYILTVSVSVASGVENMTSAFPFLNEYRVLIAGLVILLIMILNLRGIRESATIFSIPVYFFMFSIFALIGMGCYRAATGQVVTVAPLVHESFPAVSMILVLRAFASGCSALTGVEAISNGVTYFREPAPRNASLTLVMMSLLLGGMFFGITALSHVFGLIPTEQETLISILGRTVFGKNVFYFVLQGAVASILFLAANTSYAGFPSLASLLAKDRYLPRQLTMVGDRLVFSNGIIGLSVFAFGLVYLFNGSTHALLPLYAFGVFLSFTLSQAGMVIHHYRLKERGWARKLIMNALGSFTTFIVLLDIGFTKFLSGAWIVILLIPILVLLFTRIHRHYLAVGRELTLLNTDPVGELKPVKHAVVIPISGVHRGVLDAIRYAISISTDVRAIYVEIDPQTTERFKKEWQKWAPSVPLVVLKSPYRSVIRPLLAYLDEFGKSRADEMITVVIPEFVTMKRWHQLLHNQTALFIRAALLFRPKKVVTSVRYHLKQT